MKTNHEAILALVVFIFIAILSFMIGRETAPQAKPDAELVELERKIFESRLRSEFLRGENEQLGNCNKLLESLK